MVTPLHFYDSKMKIIHLSCLICPRSLLVGWFLYDLPIRDLFHQDFRIGFDRGLLAYNLS